MAENQKDKNVKLEEFKSKVREYELTSYQLSKYSGMSITGIEKILDGKTSNPTEKTLAKLMDAIEYYESTLRDEPVTLLTLNAKLDYLIDRMRLLEIDQDMLFELTKNSSTGEESKLVNLRKKINS